MQYILEILDSYEGTFITRWLLMEWLLITAGKTRVVHHLHSYSTAPVGDGAEHDPARSVYPLLAGSPILYKSFAADAKVGQRKKTAATAAAVERIRGVHLLLNERGGVNVPVNT